MRSVLCFESGVAVQSPGIGCCWCKLVHVSITSSPKMPSLVVVTPSSYGMFHFDPSPPRCCCMPPWREFFRCCNGCIADPYVIMLLYRINSHLSPDTAVTICVHFVCLRDFLTSSSARIFRAPTHHMTPSCSNLPCH